MPAALVDRHPRVAMLVAAAAGCLVGRYGFGVVANVVAVLALPATLVAGVVWTHRRGPRDAGEFDAIERRAEVTRTLGGR